MELSGSHEYEKFRKKIEHIYKTIDDHCKLVYKKTFFLHSVDMRFIFYL